MYKAKLVSIDFEVNTMDFKIKGEFTARAGKYVILTEEEYKGLIDRAQ